MSRVPGQEGEGRPVDAATGAVAGSSGDAQGGALGGGTGNKPPLVSARQRRFLISFLALVIVAALVVLVAQIFTGCWVDVGNEMGSQPAVGYVEPPRSSAPDEAVPFQGPDVPVGEAVPTNPVTRSLASQERGLASYTIFCSTCHGEAVAGAPPGAVGALFQPPPPALADRIGSLRDGDVFLAVSKGFGRMPALASRLSPEERWHLVNYLRGLVSGDAESALDSALLRGAAVFTAQCAGCHGSAGGGGLGPALYPSSLLSGSSSGEIVDLLTAGRVSLGMPAFGGRLTESELSDVASLLIALQRRGPTLLTESLDRLRTTTTSGVPPSTTTTTAAESTTTTTAPAGGLDAATKLLAVSTYTANCLGCHGVDGSGGLGSRLMPNDFIAGSSDAEVRAVIEQGRAGTAMPNWGGRLSADEIGALVALMRFWQTADHSGASEAGASSVTLPFTHKAHVAREVSCLFCHSSALRGPAADLPPLELCAGCHRWLSTQTDRTAEVLAAFDEGKTVSWARVYDLPDFVFFSHQPHVAVADVACEACHGDVGGMTLAKKAKRLTMGFCLDCHKLQDERDRLIDCQICHK